MSDKLQQQFEKPEEEVYNPEPLQNHENNYDLTYKDDNIGVEVTEKNLDNFDLSQIQDINSSFFITKLKNEDKAEMLEKMLGLGTKIASKFLQQRYLVDEFSKHTRVGGRDEWHDKLFKENSPLLKDIKQDSLRRNLMSQVAQPLGILISDGMFDYDDKLKQRANVLREQLSINPNEYDKKNVDDKIKYVQAVKQELYGFLKYLADISKEKGTVAK